MDHRLHQTCRMYLPYARSFCEARIRQDSVGCSVLLIEILTWMNKFDTSDLNFVNCQWFGLEGVARRTRFIDYWRQNEGPKNQDFYENAHLPEFSSTQDAYAEHDSKSAHQRLCDKYLVLQHSLTPSALTSRRTRPATLRLEREIIQH